MNNYLVATDRPPPDSDVIMRAQQGDADAFAVLFMHTMHCKRNRAILALLIGCGLRRAELVGLGTEDFQIREERCVIADLVGKGKHIRTVPVPLWAKRAVDEWITAAGIDGGAIFRRVHRPLCTSRTITSAACILLANNACNGCRHFQ